MSAKTLTKTEMDMLKEISKLNDQGRNYGVNYRGKSISGTITIEKLIAKGFAKGKTEWHGAYSTQSAYITPAGLRAIGCTAAQDEIVIETKSDEALTEAGTKMLRRLTTSQIIKHGTLSDMATARKLVKMGLATEKNTGKTSFFALTEDGITRRNALPVYAPAVTPVTPAIEVKPFEPSTDLIKAKTLLAQAIEMLGEKHRMVYVMEFEVTSMERRERKGEL